MIIKVQRLWLRDTYTVGRLFVNGVFMCNTLEDKDRGLTKSMSLFDIKRRKVYGETAIPIGVYDVVPYFWKKHNNWYPWIKDVPGYEGILIHGGTTAKDSLGCILIGENKIKGGLVNCQKYVRELTNMVKAENAIGNSVKIEIT